MNAEDVVTINLRNGEMQHLATYAAKAEIGGRSSVRQKDRLETCGEDQLTGMVGNYVGNLWLSGDSRAFKVTRFYANRYPTHGDGGYDVPGLNIDFKASIMRFSTNPLDYRLLVRPAERHPGWVYVLILVEPNDGKKLLPQATRAHLVGWASDRSLGEPSKDARFVGAHVVEARHLNPLPPFQWEFAA